MNFKIVLNDLYVLADLIKVDLSEIEAQSILPEFNSILQSMEQLKQIDVSECKAISSPYKKIVSFESLSKDLKKPFQKKEFQKSLDKNENFHNSYYVINK